MTKSNATVQIIAGPGAGATNELRPLKPLADIPIGPWPWIAGIIAVAAMVLLWWWLRRNAGRSLPANPEPIIPPHVRARQRLEQALGLLSDPRLFCIAVSDATRLYLEERFDLHAPERTTEEFLYELQRTHHLTAGQKETLAQFLERCDLVKFARFEPAEIELRGLHRIAERLVDETEPAVVEQSPSPNAPPKKEGSKP